MGYINGLPAACQAQVGGALFHRRIFATMMEHGSHRDKP
jgi:hypothetical protein